jgi:hypothetical protein
LKDAERHQIALAIIDMLPDDPRDALTVLVMSLANVAVSTECSDEPLFNALQVALRQRRGLPGRLS